MKGILKHCHLPENLEILFMLALGILLQMTDGSPFSMKERWLLVWNTDLPPEYFSLLVQKFIKIILSAIVVVRCATTYAYVMSAMLVIFSLSKKTAPKLMLPWLLVSALKSVGMTFVEALTGVYVCSAFGGIRKACIEFFISKALEIIFATYLWGNVLNIYQEMERKAENEVNLQTKDQMFTQKMEFGRQRARSLLDESTLYKTACLNNFEFKDVPQIILQMLRRGNEMSQDSLLGSGMMLASVSNLGSFDNLKTSQSLGELGYMDLRTIQVVGLEEDENLSHRDKALRFLKLTWSDVERIKINRTAVENDIYAVDEKTWKRLMASGTHINKPKQARTEVFIREIPQSDLGEDNIPKTKNHLKFDFKFGFSFSNLFNQKLTDCQSDQDEDDSLIFSQDEDEERDDEVPTQIFMSNIKGDNVNQCYLNLGLKKTKGTEYAELYQQDFMSEIGPEVFDRAPNLPKVTSLTKNPRDLELRASVSLPAFQEVKQASIRKISLSKDSKEKVFQSSSSDFYFSGSEYLINEDSIAFAEPSSGEKIKSDPTLNTTEEEKLVHSSFYVEHQKTENEVTKIAKNEELKLEVVDIFSDNESYKIKGKSPVISLKVSRRRMDNIDEVKSKTCIKKRKILIKRIGKRGANAPFCKLSSDSRSYDFVNAKPEFINDSTKNRSESVMSRGTKTSNPSLYNLGKEFLSSNENQIYFLLELLQKPLVEVLVTYYDLKKRVKLQGKDSCSQKTIDLFYNCISENESELPQEKNWKSNVLKLVGTFKEDSKETKENPLLTFTSFLNIIKKKSVMKKLLKYEYFYWKNKKKHFLTEQEAFPFWTDEEDGEFGSCSNIKSMNIDVSRISDDSINSKVEIDVGLNLDNDSMTTADGESPKTSKHERGSCSQSSERSPEIIHIDFISYKISKINTRIADKPLSNSKIQNNDSDIEDIEADVEDVREVEIREKFDLEKTKSEIASTTNNGTENKSICSQESEEPISLYYSKAANLASPLLDMKRFIYPDHIHYSYKHVKKRGFDVDINGGFPLLVRENITISSPLIMKNEAVITNPEFEIKRRPMDLSFATTNAFTEWQNNDQNDIDSVSSETIRSQISGSRSSNKKKPKSADFVKNKKMKKLKRSKKSNDGNESRPPTIKEKDCSKPKSNERNLSDSCYFYSPKDYLLVEKLLRMHMRFNSNEYNECEKLKNERKPVPISSAQLHSNKGRKNSTYNPAIFLQENIKTKNEKKKVETPEKRTKDMFARLEREALFQNKNVQKLLGSNWDA